LKRRVLRIGAIIGAATVSTLAVAPAFAAATVSQSSARALNLNLAGNNITSGLGMVKATNDGTTESKSGPTDPPIGVLQNQGLLNLGVLVQEATAKVASNGDGKSAACSGVAGNGGSGSLAKVGDSSCITPGSPVGISLANLDLSKVVTIDPASALGALAALNAPLQQILGAVTKPLSDGLQGALGNLSIGGSLGAIESQCTAAPGTASGTTHLVNTTGNSNDTPITLNVAGQKVVIASLPVNPKPNQKVVSDLSGVTEAIIAGVDQQLTQGLNGSLSALKALPDALQTQVISTLANALKPLLDPIEQNVLDITLNKQVKTGADKIDVTAIDLQLLPVAKSQLGFSALDAQIAEVSCGPNSRVVAPSTPVATVKPPTAAHLPHVPTAIDSGMAGHADHTARNVLGATAALMLLAGTAGLLGYRRMLNK
jgi:hypothetical protein